MSVESLLEAWKRDAVVKLGVWVHPRCRMRNHTALFTLCVKHALTKPLNEEVIPIAASLPCAPWSSFMRSITVERIPATYIAELLDSDDAFNICPQNIPGGFTHTMGLVPRYWLQRRVALTRNGGFSVTDMNRDAALIDEERYLCRDPPARSYAKLAPHDKIVQIGLYGRYVLNHEAGHLFGLGHPKRDSVSITRSPYHPCMDQQTVNARPELIPLPLPSILDIEMQEPRSIEFALRKLAIMREQQQR